MSNNQYNYYSVANLEKIRWKLQAIRRVVKEGHSYSTPPPREGVNRINKYIKSMSDKRSRLKAFSSQNWIDSCYSCY